MTNYGRPIGNYRTQAIHAGVRQWLHEHPGAWVNLDLNSTKRNSGWWVVASMLQRDGIYSRTTRQTEIIRTVKRLIKARAI